MEEKTPQNCARERLEMEFREIDKNPPTHISFGPVSEDDMFQWQGIIMGPVDTLLDGYIFQLSLKFPSDYPFSPPQVKFQTKVYHPNVDEAGTIDISLLGEKWSPAITIEKLLLSISSILWDPILEDTQNPITDGYWE
ncbi:Ubiquitin-conjugating enzyme like [Actinidia chinensis var. chinensis]|uniref:Ubiquitin-conjugating enzyme like n=1 Tax=Actinidia chinensis var. chinensis TaxID=1590841 RepID=A0A2R6S093_ACTCC|nr:Ubiquitin-conjugating enzyme like [Actinidia chinensis var. chinensis]